MTTKRKKPARAKAPEVEVEQLPVEEGEAGESHDHDPEHDPEPESVTARTARPADALEQAMHDTARESERALLAAAISPLDDIETTVNVAGDMLPFPGRDDLDEPTMNVPGEELGEVDSVLLQRRHLRGLLEALVFASDAPIKPKELARHASAPIKQVGELLLEIKQDYLTRGIHLEEVGGGWVFRTSAQYAPFIRDLTKQRPVRLTRAQVETLAIIAYRQPITRPEIDDVRGVDSGPVLKLLLERDLVRILGKRDEPGRPLIYGTTQAFLEFFGLKSLKDLPTLREFTELTEESRDKYEDEMGEPPNDAPPPEEEGMRGPMPTLLDDGDDDSPTAEHDLDLNLTTADDEELSPLSSGDTDATLRHPHDETEAGSHPIALESTEDEDEEDDDDESEYDEEDEDDDDDDDDDEDDDDEEEDDEEEDDE